MSVAEVPRARPKGLRTFSSSWMAMLVAWAAVPATAQVPTNLQVLPASLGRDSLIAVMGSFTRALGVRCTHCHVARDGVRPQPDEFALDGLETKRTARAMLRMVAAINDQHLPATGRDRRQLLRVGCATCHRGVARPVPLEDLLYDEYRRVGLDSAIARYRVLRERYYGSGAYDFSDITLPTLGDRIAGEALRTRDAMRIMTLNLEFYPQSWFTYQQLGQVQVAAGDTADAILSYKRGLAINPTREFLRDLLREIEKR